MLGLIVYGMLKRQWSLRELEGLAKCDAGAWLVCGGHQPDHSTIGKFIQLHSEILSEEFFVDLVKQLARQLNLHTGVAAVDGTVIEAAVSRFGLLRAEAARAAAEQAQRAAAADPHDPELAEQAQVAQAAANVAEERNARRSAAGLKGETKVAPGESEAVYQPRKDGVRCAAYQPSVLVEQSEFEGELGAVKIELIVGQGVHPSSEPALFNPLLAQHLTSFGCDPATVLADAGYASLKIFADCYARNLDLLCPSGQTRSNAAWAKRVTRANSASPHLPTTRRAIFIAVRQEVNCSGTSALTLTVADGATRATRGWPATTAPCVSSAPRPKARVRSNATAMKNSRRA